jgi:hypothetical protein
MLGRRRADDAVREAGRRVVGPVALAVEADLVLVRRPGLEPGDVHERVVVAADVERARLAAEDLGGAGRVGLHPHRRLRLVDVAQHGAEDQGGHAADGSD